VLATFATLAPTAPGAAMPAVDPPAPTTSATPTAPADLGTDPVLDDLPVDATSDSRAAERTYADARTKQQQAVDAQRSAEQDRSRLTDQAVAAVRAEAGARDTRNRIQAREEATRLELARRRTVETLASTDFVVEQLGLRRLAAAVVAASTEDRYDIFAAGDDASRYQRRSAIKDRAIEEQTGRVQARRRPWLEARRSVRRQDVRVARAQAETGAAGRALTKATHTRVDLERRVAAAVTEAARRRQTVETAAAQTLAAALGRRSARLTAQVTGLDMPLVAVDAYWRAAGKAPCTVPWWLLAGVGQTESRHGTAQGSHLDATGTTTNHILGIQLNGTGGTAAIPDTDGGRLDDDPVWDRAVGPMQFIPSTWARWATDDNGDGVADPHNLYDAAGAAANYLCFGRAGLTDVASQTSALLSYNASLPYVATVLAAGHAYQAALPIPDAAPKASPVP
jgi:membrane-bound lytic murein transglycosylase B